MNRPVIYQLFVRLFSNTNLTNSFDGELSVNGSGKFNRITTKALQEIKKMGFTHIWFTGVLEHSTTTGFPGIAPDQASVVKGKAGSPYAVRDYYDVDAALAENTVKRMEEFEELIERTHDAGLKVLIDFVPNHLARTYRSDVRPAGIEEFGNNDHISHRFDPQNNFYYLPGEMLHLPSGDEGNYRELPARATGNDCFTASPSVNDWYETVKLNYGVDYENGKTTHFEPVPDTWLKMNHILKFWAEKGIDGFRCDMAAMVPLPFWSQAIGEIKKAFPGIMFIAEIYEPWLYNEFVGEGRFDYLYDKVGLYDTVRAVTTRQAPASMVSNCWRSVEGLGDHMLSFTENHDEQRVASIFFAGTPLAGIPPFVVTAFINRGAVMVYNGQELGEDGTFPVGFSGDDGRTSIFDYGAMPSMARWVNDGLFDGGKLNAAEKDLRSTYSTLLSYINLYPAFSEGGFYDLMWVNHQGDGFPDNHVYAFLRYLKDEVMLVATNFSAEHRRACIRIPSHAIRFIGMKVPEGSRFRRLADQAEFRLNLQPNGDVLLDDITLEGFGYFIGELIH